MLQTIQYGKATKDPAVWSMDADAIVRTESKSLFSFGSSESIHEWEVLCCKFFCSEGK